MSPIGVSKRSQGDFRTVPRENSSGQVREKDLEGKERAQKKREEEKRYDRKGVKNGNSVRGDWLEGRGRLEQIR